MGKALQNKIQKRTALLESAYELFTTLGFSKTTIREIADKAGVAKGTFYLYFEDKTDIRNALIRAKASELLQSACASMDEYISTCPEGLDTADKFIYIIDYIVDLLSDNAAFVGFISKHLSWGLFTKGPRSPQEYYGIDDGTSPVIDFEDYIQSMLDADNVRIRDLKVLLFNLLGLISSTTYDLTLYKEPMSLEEFRPHMHHAVRLLVNDAIISD